MNPPLFELRGSLSCKSHLIFINYFIYSFNSSFRSDIIGLLIDYCCLYCLLLVDICGLDIFDRSDLVLSYITFSFIHMWIWVSEYNSILDLFLWFIRVFGSYWGVKSWIEVSLTILWWCFGWNSFIQGCLDNCGLLSFSLFQIVLVV